MSVRIPIARPSGRWPGGPVKPGLQASAIQPKEAPEAAATSCSSPATRSIEAKKDCRCWRRFSASGTGSSAPCSSRSIQTGRSIPRTRKSVSDSAALDSADAVVMLLRFRTWPDEDMARFEKLPECRASQSSRCGRARTRSTVSRRAADGSLGTTTTREGSESACSAKRGSPTGASTKSKRHAA